MRPYENAGQVHYLAGFFMYARSGSHILGNLSKRRSNHANAQPAPNEQSCSALRMPIRDTEQAADQKFRRGAFNRIGTSGRADISQRRTNMLWTICVVLVILWLLGFTLHIGGGLIHLLLVVALVVLVINLLSGRRGIA